MHLWKGNKYSLKWVTVVNSFSFESRISKKYSAVTCFCPESHTPLNRYKNSNLCRTSWIIQQGYRAMGFSSTNKFLGKNQLIRLIGQWLRHITYGLKYARNTIILSIFDLQGQSGLFYIAKINKELASLSRPMIRRKQNKKRTPYPVSILKLN